MQVKDIYATGNGSLPKNSKLLGESKKKKAAEIAARAVESSAKNPLAGANNSGYNTSENTFDAIMQRLEESDKSPEMQEILGNANPSKSPEEVGAENWRGQINDTPPEYPEKIRPARQYEKNKDVDLSEVMDEQGHINGQGRDSIADMRYGAAKVENAGCESIAVYNLLRDMGVDISFADVIRTADEINSFSLGGLMGILPEGTRRLLRDYGVRYEEVNKNVLQSCADHGYMKDREQYIVSIWNQWPEKGKSGAINLAKGIHTFLMVYDKDGREIGNTGEIGHWIVYNRFKNSAEEKVYKNLTDVLEGNGRYCQILGINGGN